MSVRALRLPAVRSRLAERILPEADLHRILSLETAPRNRAILTLPLRLRDARQRAMWSLLAGSDGGQVTVLGKGGVTRAVKIPASVWKLTSLRDAKAESGDPVFRSRKGKNGGVLRPLAVLQVVRQAAARARIELNVSRTGSGTRTPPMLSAVVRLSTWSRPPSDTPASPRREGIYMPGLTTAPAVSSRFKLARTNRS